MGTYQEEINCPVCNSQNCLSDYNYRTGEVYKSCKCGYTYEFKWRRDESGTLVLKDKKKEVSEENIIPEIYEIKNPFGSYEVHYNNTLAFETGPIENLEQFEAFKKYLAENRKKDQIKEVIVHRFVDGKFISEKL